MNEALSHELPERVAVSHRWRIYILLLSCALLAIAALSCTFLNQPTLQFPSGQQIHIASGTSLSRVSDILAEEHVVRSRIFFRFFVMALGEASSLPAGTHTFTKPLTTREVIDALLDGSSRTPPIRITIPEGATLKDFDRIIAAALPAVHEGDIVAAAKENEGILFPDTYLFNTDATAHDVVSLLAETFTQKLAPLEVAFKNSPLSREEVIVLASLIEREGNDETSMGLISGILHKRLHMGMPLQVDATFDYLLGKASAELTADDLAVDSPFNTYTQTGLPPQPICSPGMTALRAALNPTPSPYIYYLTGSDGTFRYARTFDEHKINKARYLP